MEGLNVCVSNFFSVKQDGDICIPWDWKIQDGDGQKKTYGCPLDLQEKQCGGTAYY